VGKDILV